MGALEVSKKVHFLGIWNEDNITEEVINNVLAKARTEKGKKVKLVMNESGLKLIRSRIFQENKSTFVPLKELKTVTRSAEVSVCNLFILSDANTKYKILGVRCSSDSDAAQINAVFADIQKKLQSKKLELRQNDRGNWTLREKNILTPNRHVTEIFVDRRRPGEAVNGFATPPIQDGISANKDKDHQVASAQIKSVYVKRSNRGSGSSKVSRKKAAVSADAAQRGGNVLKDEVFSADPQRWDRGAPGRYESANETNSRGPGLENYELRREQSEYLRYEPHPVRETREDPRAEADITRYHHSEQRPGHKSNDPRHVPIRAQVSLPHETLYAQRWQAPVSSRAYARQDSRSGTPVVMTRTLTLPKPVSYRPVPSQVIDYRPEPSTNYYINPWATYRRPSMQMEQYATTAYVDRKKIKSDQRSVRSNTSHRKRSSDFRVPSTVVRAIEDTYRRPVMFVQGSPPRMVSYNPQMSGYHIVRTTDPRIDLRTDPEVDSIARRTR